MEHYVYLMECADGTLYCGYTTDPKRREQQHNAGCGAKYTAARRPVRLVYTEVYPTRQEAMHREWEIKKCSRTEKLKMIKKWQEA